jgi:hypothetical protein
MTSTTDGTTVSDGRARAALTTIDAAPGWLALAVYGRVRIDMVPFNVAGPADAADRFAGVFGPVP